jgi:ABC-2 type transport system permease protein
MWRNTWAVIRREYLERVRSKSFLFGTIGVPVLMLLMMAGPFIMEARSDSGEQRMAVIDHTGVLGERLEPGLKELGWSVDLVSPGPGAERTLRERAVVGEITGFVLLDEGTLANGVATLETTVRPSAVRSFALRMAITRAAMEQRLEASGNAEEILSGGALRVEMLADVSGADPDGDEPEFLVAFFGAMIIYMVILIYSVAVMRATLEEKTSRIVEVIVSSMEPWHLLLGKIIGVGGVSLTQLTIWIAAGTAAALAGIPTLMTARPDLTGLVDVQAALPGLGMLALYVGYFLFGFFMFSGIYAAVGAMCNTDEEANQAQFPVVMLLIAPVMLLVPVLQEPSARWAVMTSLFPLFSPILMWGRLVAGGVTAWEVALSFALMTLAILAIAWLAGRIYRVGILMTGKRPTLPELWRWVRAA